VLGGSIAAMAGVMRFEVFTAMKIPVVVFWFDTM
jgi:hypothetical protein